MQYLVDARNPRHEITPVTADELPDAYANLAERDGATVLWNDGGDDMLIVAVGDDHCVISLKSDETWYYLTVSGDEEQVEVDMGGTDSYVPRKALAPRALGLTVLQRADDLPGLRTDYTWDEQ